MDEMQLVKDLRRATPVITEDAEAVARTRLLATLTAAEPAPQRHHSRTRKIAWRTAVAGALAATVAVGFTVVQNIGGNHASVADAAVVEVLDHASAAAAARPFAAPRADQWVYQRSIYTDGSSLKTSMIKDEFTGWFQASRRESYVREPGGGPLVKIVPKDTDFPPSDYATLSKLPTEPADLLEWIHTHRPKGNTDTDFQILSGILEQPGLLPPRVEVAVFQTVKKLPEVTIRRNVLDLLGKPTIAVVGVSGSYQVDSSGKHIADLDEILLDPVTYAFRGNDSVLSADVHDTFPAYLYKYKPEVVAEDQKRDKAGSLQSAGVVLQTGIVDKVGQQP